MAPSEELQWKQYALLSDLFKHYLDLLLKLNIFYYVRNRKNARRCRSDRAGVDRQPILPQTEDVMAQIVQRTWKSGPRKTRKTAWRAARNCSSELTGAQGCRRL